MATEIRDKPVVPRTRYKDDLDTWVQEQVALLRAGRLDEEDALNVAEAQSDLGRSEFRALESAMTGTPAEPFKRALGMASRAIAGGKAKQVGAGEQRCPHPY